MPARKRSTLPSNSLAVPHTVHGDSPFDVAETSIRLLTTGPEPLAVDGAHLGHGLPRRRIPLHELAAVSMHPTCSYAASDAAWRLLVQRARTGGPAWVVGAVGVALPGLRAAERRLNRQHTGDVQAEVLAAFVGALQRVDVEPPRVAQRLCSATLVTARAALRDSEPTRAKVTGPGPVSTPPPAPAGHPDFVLARAVAAGVITAREADIVGATRLEDEPIAAYADRAGLGTWAAYKTRARAEERLATAVRAGQLTDDDQAVIAEATLTVLPESAPL